MDSARLKFEATLHRTRLLLGLTDGDATVAWADERLRELAVAPAPVLDISLTDASDLSALRLALLPLTGKPKIRLLSSSYFTRWLPISRGRDCSLRSAEARQASDARLHAAYCAMPLAHLLLVAATFTS